MLCSVNQVGFTHDNREPRDREGFHCRVWRDSDAYNYVIPVRDRSPYVPQRHRKEPDSGNKEERLDVLNKLHGRLKYVAARRRFYHGGDSRKEREFRREMWAFDQWLDGYARTEVCVLSFRILCLSAEVDVDKWHRKLKRIIVRTRQWIKETPKPGLAPNIVVTQGKRRYVTIQWGKLGFAFDPYDLEHWDELRKAHNHSIGHERYSGPESMLDLLGRMLRELSANPEMLMLGRDGLVLKKVKESAAVVSFWGNPLFHVKTFS